MVVLRQADLPPGFVSRPFNERNLPTQLTGCPRLEALVAGAGWAHKQVEFFKAPFGPWIDEAVISPAHGAANRLSGKLTSALAGCRSVTVTEEGHRVRLALAPASAPPGAVQAHAYRASGQLAGIALNMDIVLARAGGVILLVTNTSIIGPTDASLTAQAVRAAAQRATGT
jgi:hypothetical protein